MSTLPQGLRVRLDARTTIAADGSLLVGGSPLTALRLSAVARGHLRERCVEVVDESSAHLADRLLATNMAQPETADARPLDGTDLTVVIPVHNHAEDLDRALKALTGLRCVVIDDASTASASGEVAAVADAHRATLVRLPRNLGPAGARNAGLDEVYTPYVAFVDSDIEMSADALCALGKHFVDPAVVMVGPRITGRSRHARPRWFERYDAVASSLTLGIAPAVVRPRSKAAWLPSACLLARVDVVRDELHGFDPTMRVGEDVDLVWRLAEKGHRVRYDPAVAAAHATRTTVSGWRGRKFVYGTTGATHGLRHGAAVAPAVLSPAFALAAAALLVRHRRSAPITLLCLGIGIRSVRRHLPPVPERDLLAARLAVRGLGWAVRQESALLLRHWWPLTLLGLRHSAVRRAVRTALVVDSAVAAWELRDAEARPSPLTVLLARRLDDLAYGAGLWWGALGSRTAIPLLPRRR
jgi:mycofactocin system glycosyltransferase